MTIIDTEMRAINRENTANKQAWAENQIFAHHLRRRKKQSSLSKPTGYRELRQSSTYIDFQDHIPCTHKINMKTRHYQVANELAIK